MIGQRLFRAALLAAAALLPARLACGLSPSCAPTRPGNGALCLPDTAINAGGNCLKSTGAGSCLSAAGLRLISSIGSHNTFMQGGTLQLWSGVIAAAKTAAFDARGAHAYPTPFLHSQGHDRITFAQLPAQATIKIFTLSGRLVKTLSKLDSTDQLVWTPVANEQGSLLASGVYPFIVIQPGVSKKQGKIMIIR